MRTIKYLLIAALLCGIPHKGEAQILNKLKNKVLDKTEKAIVDKAAEKVAEKTVEATDEMFQPDLGDILQKAGKPVDVERLPEVYRFDYLYSLKMTAGEGNMQMDYYLNKTEPYLGMKPDAGTDMAMVIDERNNALVTIVNGQAFAMELTIDPQEGMDNTASYSDYTITELPNRTFLGYDCLGRRMENDEYTFIVYIAPNTEVGFGNVFKSKHTNIPPAMRSLSKEYEKGLMMYMEIEDKKGKGSKADNSIMECVAFEKSDREIRTR
jgi:hypothetical protein